MEAQKSYINRNLAWMVSGGVAALGYVSLQVLKASNLIEPGASDVPYWAWVPLAITVVGVIAMMLSILVCRSQTARALKSIAIFFVIAMFFKYTLGFIFFN